MVQLAGAVSMSGTSHSRTAVKTYAFPSPFATAKISRVPLSKIEATGGDAAEKLGRVITVPGGRPNKTSTFNSAL